MPTDYRNKPWEKWNAFDWSDALLAHFFARTATEDGPVRVIVATEEEIAHAIDDPAADPEAVAQSLVETTLNAVRDDNYWNHAAGRRGREKPDYLPHLVVGCMAAIDLTDEDENSYIERLCELVGETGDRRLEIMATLWKELAQWLDDHPRDYRPLVLPDPKGWVRIGHTVRLAFPSRRDQRKLFDVLTDQDLLVQAPPIGAVKAAVQQNRGVFSKRFVEEFEEFAADFDRGAQMAQLADSPFWDAVLAVVQLSLDTEGETSRQSWTLLGEDDGFGLSLRVATTESRGIGSLKAVASEWYPEPWTYALEGDHILEVVLGGELPALGNLGGLVRGGLIPLAEGLHGELEVAAKQYLSDTLVAVVRDDLVKEVVDQYGGRRGKFAVDGWSVVREPALALSRSDTFQGSGLEHCWILHETPFPRSIRLVGGIRVEGRHLWLREHLPHVRADGAESALLEIRNEVFELSQASDLFLIDRGLVPADVAGEVTVVVGYGDEDRSKKFDFVPAPSTEDYRLPSDLAAWLREGCAQAERFECPPDEQQEVVPPLIGNADRTVKLDRDVGSWAEGGLKAVWEVTEFGSTSLGRLISSESECVPTGQSANKGANRKWRRTLATADYEDDTHQALSRSAASAGDLPIVGTTVAPPSTSVAKSRAPHQRLGEMVATVIALANTSTGISTKKFLDLTSGLMALDAANSWPVLRSWMEAGLLEAGVLRRWSNRKLFAVRPRLELFRTNRWFGARVAGLALESTLRHLEEAASDVGVVCHRQEALGGLTPYTLALRSGDPGPLRSIAATLRLPVVAATENPWTGGDGPDVTSQIPPTYDETGYLHRDERWGKSTLQQRTRPGAPTYWFVDATAGNTWAYHRDAAQFWACVLAKRPVVGRSGAVLDVAGAYLPLTVSRYINTVAETLSGPGRGGAGYSYHCPSAELAEQIESQLTDFASNGLAELTGR